MTSLFKYLHKQHVENFLRGEILFRSLAYFRDYEDAQVRGDRREGSRLFAPTEGLTIHHSRHGTSTQPRTAFRSEAREVQRIFVLCMSTILSDELAVRFGCDACIEIINFQAYTSRLRVAVRRKNKRLIHDSVAYYSATDGPGTTHELPEQIVMCKLKEPFEWQHEYRFAFGSTKAFAFGNVKQFLDVGTPAHVKAAPHRDTEILRLGSLHDICRVPTLFGKTTVT